MEVMEMASDYSGWFVKYLVVIDLNPVLGAHPVRSQFVILYLFREKENYDEVEESSPALWLHMPGISLSVDVKSISTLIDDHCDKPKEKRSTVGLKLQNDMLAYFLLSRLQNIWPKLDSVNFVSCIIQLFPPVLRRLKGETYIC
ncbi:uncharacterized protein LOC121050216 [Rosa chinensis]|uniref:uncharacterized protein LOC121050216 n=1 Tax=Rosa chinensis TaxID=74649 RepID=UPI001AD8F20B|nr:uncharacterized protein LOC121050216 [Rosa chinensis]